MSWRGLVGSAQLHALRAFSPGRRGDLGRRPSLKEAYERRAGLRRPPGAIIHQAESAPFMCAGGVGEQGFCEQVSQVIEASIAGSPPVGRGPRSRPQRMQA